MKRISIIFAAIVMILSGTNVFAQGKYGADSAECIKYLSFYKEYYKQKSYDEAIPNWRQAFRLCPPTANQNMLVDGVSLMRQLIKKNAKNPVYKAKLVDSLFMIYDVRIANYPKYAVTARNNKALDAANYIQDDPERLYKLYGEVIDANGTKTKPSIFLFYFSSACEMFRNGMIDEEAIIGDYEKCIETLSNIDAKDQDEQDSINDVKSKVEEMFVSNNVADCDKLIELYTPKMEETPDNVELASKIVRFMSAAGDCTNNKLFISAVTLLHEKEPSHSSAYMLYKLYSSVGKPDLAVKYLQEAIDREDSDAAQDAEYGYELAVYNYKCGNTVAAEKAARAAAAKNVNPEITGKSYMLIGTIWGAVRCEGNDIAKRAPYWVAVDYFERAKRADAALAAEANQRIAEYSKYFPLTADAFMFGVNDGDQYEVSCGGLRATTTVRTQN